MNTYRVRFQTCETFLIPAANGAEAMGRAVQQGAFRGQEVTSLELVEWPTSGRGPTPEDQDPVLLAQQLFMERL